MTPLVDDPHEAEVVRRPEGRRVYYEVHWNERILWSGKDRLWAVAFAAGFNTAVREARS